MLKHSGENGVVVNIIDRLMVEVDVKGVTFPVYIDDLDHPYLKWFTEKPAKKKSQAPPEIPVEKPEKKLPRMSKGIYLSFIPVFKTADNEEIVDFLKVYLLNEVPNDIILTYDCRIANKSIFSIESALQGFGNIYLHNVSWEDMNDHPRFNWKLADATGKNSEVEEGILQIKPAKAFEQIDKLMKNNEASFAYLLITDFKPRKKPEPKVHYAPVIKPNYIETPTLKNLEKARHEIDLHIDALVQNPKALTKAEIILIQLETLKHYLQIAIVHRQEIMIVIHGLGKGTLREEVHKVLKQTPEVARFKNEWSGKYGFGATEIWFRY